MPYRATLWRNSAGQSIELVANPNGNYEFVPEITEWLLTEAGFERYA